MTLYELKNKLKMRCAELKVDRIRIQTSIKHERERLRAHEISIEECLGSGYFECAKQFQKMAIGCENRIKSLEKIDKSLAAHQKQYGLCVQWIKSYEGQNRHLRSSNDPADKVKWSWNVGKLIAKITSTLIYVSVYNEDDWNKFNAW